MVSDLLRVATGRSDPALVTRGSRLRFGEASSAPSVVVWNVCRHCNMTCPHCYAAAGRAASAADLTTDEGRRLLDEMAASGVRVVIFSGGEPLLRGDLLELARHAASLGLAPQLSTNGVLIDTRVARELKSAGVGYVGISIDGIGLRNDAYRGLAGGFARAVAALRASKDAGIRTGLRVTLTRRNLDDLAKLHELAREVGADRFYVSHLVDAGRGVLMASEDLDRAEARRALHELFERSLQALADGRGPDVVTGSNDSDGPLLVLWVRRCLGAEAASRVEQLLAARGGNSAGERLLNVDHRGRVHPDQFWTSRTLGSVRRQPFAEILAHPLRRELRERAQRLTGRCGSCRHVALCRGSHRERAEARHGDAWAADPACVMTDEEVGFEEQVGEIAAVGIASNPGGAA